MFNRTRKSVNQPQPCAHLSAELWLLSNLCYLWRKWYRKVAEIYFTTWKTSRMLSNFVAKYYWHFPTTKHSVGCERTRSPLICLASVTLGGVLWLPHLPVPKPQLRNNRCQAAMVCPSRKGGIAIVRGVAMRQTFVIYVRILI